MAASDYVLIDEFRHILAALTPANRLAIEVSLSTGLRISDVLELRTGLLKKRMIVWEKKTGKRKFVYINSDLLEQILRQAGRIYVFEGRTNPNKHRSRQAVYKDIKRAARLFRIPQKMVVSPHSARKIYAVNALKKYGNLEKVQNLLNHSSEAVTMVYAMADILTARKLGEKYERVCRSFGDSC